MDSTDSNGSQPFDPEQLREQYSYYAKRLLEDLGLSSVGQPQRGKLLAAIETYVQQVILNTLLENVSEDALKEAEKMLDQDAPREQVVAYLLVSTPDIELFVAEALMESYARMVDESKQLAEAITAKSSETQKPSESTDSPAGTN